MNNLQNVPIASIQVGTRARQDLGGPEFMLLKESITDKGVLQPITLDSDFRLLAGGRRVQACRELEIPTIPALIRPVSGELDAKEVELFENVHRKGLTWQEQDALYLEIHELQDAKHGKDWTQTKTAGLLNKSVGSISMTLRRANATKAIPELANCHTAKDAQRLLNKIEENLVVKQMAESIREEIEEEQEAPAEGRQPRLVEHADSHFQVGDALAGLTELAEIYQKQESAIALLEVDPPYAIELQEAKYSKGTNPDLQQHYTEVDPLEYRIWLADLYGKCYSVAAHHAWLIAWFGPTWFHETKVALQNSGWSVDDMPIIWSKKQGQTQQPNHYLARAYEMAFICRKGQPLLNKRGRLNVFQFDTVPAAKKYHPTQRPVALMREILATFGFPGQVVCIPFLGSGSTLKAVYQQEMMGFGWDLDQKNKDHFLVSLDGDG